MNKKAIKYLLVGVILFISCSVGYVWYVEGHIFYNGSEHGGELGYPVFADNYNGIYVDHEFHLLVTNPRPNSINMSYDYTITTNGFTYKNWTKVEVKQHRVAFEDRTEWRRYNVLYLNGSEYPPGLIFISVSPKYTVEGYTIYPPQTYSWYNTRYGLKEE
jgi:hypothetical protein